MTTITAKIIADTVWPAPPTGTRITTMQLRYPRFIHAEFMTHRAFSRNASSSRAIPVEKLIKDVETTTLRPIHWGKNQPGMQAREEIDDRSKGDAVITWERAQTDAIKYARRLVRLGVHKQIVNRLLEPFAYINVVVTATEWDNFFYLRDHPDAEPHIQELARVMKEAMEESTIEVSPIHVPYILHEEKMSAKPENIILVSAARCARVSYMTHEGKEPDWHADLELAGKLSGEPPHLSPFEHQARWAGGHSSPHHKKDWYANFHAWRSQRFCMERGFTF